MPRPERSTVASASASSSGARAEPKRRTPARSPSAMSKRLAERDRAVLDGVVLVDPEVAVAAQLDVGERPEREAREHVVEEAEAGRDARAAAAEQADAHLDARLARRAAHLADALAAHAVVGRRRLAARELGERAQQARVGGAVRDGDAEAVGQQRLVRERAHGAAALDEAASKTSGTGERASTKLPACASTSTPARAHAGGQPAALLDDRGAARLAAPRSRGRRARRRPPTRTRSSPGGRSASSASASAGCARP